MRGAMEAGWKGARCRAAGRFARERGLLGEEPCMGGEEGHRMALMATIERAKGAAVERGSGKKGTMLEARKRKRLKGGGLRVSAGVSKRSMEVQKPDGAKPAKPSVRARGSRGQGRVAEDCGPVRR